MTEAASTVPLQFTPFASQISPSFWTSLSSLKIDTLQLSDEAIPLQAKYTIGKAIHDKISGDVIRLPAQVQLDSSSFTISNNLSNNFNELFVTMQGWLKIFNTIEDFKNADKSILLANEGEKLLNEFLNSNNPLSSISKFFIICFADLKRYKFIHWFAFPALLSSPSWKIIKWQSVKESTITSNALNKISNKFSDLPISENGVLIFTSNGKIGKFMEFNSFFENVAEDDRFIAFIDPSSSSDSPGWPLRNLLTLLSIRFNVKRIKVLCWRDEAISIGTKSIITEVGLDENNTGVKISRDGKELSIQSDSKSLSIPITVGWERNANAKLAPKMADLGPSMDPQKLADQAVDLNLKLMRWRILPEINLERVATSKCLLLGAGTLGCYIARALLGWGVRHLTFVDSSTVSFSNPVRQPLFEFQDCLQGGKPKAQCAADALKRIRPGVYSKGFKINIPMPGHPIPSAHHDQTRNDLRQLEQLFDDHDVIFLLMDSRESRWLPTVLGSLKGKIVINTALGFDSFVVMRHGASPSQHAQFPESISRRLGCYFCNDVVAPTDSLTDRTLDQMCTVTRPGLAAIAGALSVELMVSLLQHSLGNIAPASGQQLHSSDKTNAKSILGNLPHQLRGTLYDFQTLQIHGPAYSQCTACSATIIKEYAKNSFETVKQACNDELFLQKITGLDELYNAANQVDVDWSEDDEDEDD